MLRIIKLNQGLFTVFEKGIPNSEITLDFNPFVEKYNLKLGLILHLRARPPQQPCHWSYGIYEIENDNYLSIDNIESTRDTHEFFSACIPDLETKPTHVLVYPQSVIMYSNSKLICLKSSNAVAEAIDDAPLKKVKK